jgi:hypothetical protein
VKAAETRIECEMGYSAAEFSALLPAAMRDWRVAGGPEAWSVVEHNGGSIARILIQSRPERRIGALSLPVLMVTIEMDDAPIELREEFLRRLERGFHRGGG